jgi:16S rRNA (guanine527-N7)-methyltransferase
MNKHFSKIDAISWSKWLKEGAKHLEKDIDEAQIHQLKRFADELLIANLSVNLTSVTDPIEIAEKLMLDSIMPGRFISPGSSVLDLGTGAGFPGIPLKIAYPSLSMTLLDSKRRKINFIKFIIRHLNLIQTKAIQARAEELSAKPEYAAAFDVVVSRAVTSLDWFFSLAGPFLKKSGIMIAMKGSEYSLELEKSENIGDEQMMTDLDLNKYSDCQVFPYQLPISGKERNLVIARFTGASINPVRSK